MFLLIIWEFHTGHSDHTYFPVLLCPTSTIVTFLTTKKKKQKKIVITICVAHIHTGTWSNSQWPLPLIKLSPFTSLPLPEIIISFLSATFQELPCPVKSAAAQIMDFHMVRVAAWTTGLLQPYRLWTSTQPSAAAWTTDTIIALGSSKGQEYKYSLHIFQRHFSVLFNVQNGYLRLHELCSKT